MSEKTDAGTGEGGVNEKDTALPSGAIQEAVMGMPPTIPVPGGGATTARASPSPFQGMPMMDPMQMQLMLQNQAMMINSMQQNQATNAAAAAATASKGKKKSTGGAGTRYTESEYKIFLAAMEETLPIGHEEWLVVTNSFNSQVDEGRQREKANLQSKWKTMVSCKKPTGDPTCPWHIKKAKRIEYARSNKTEMSTMGTAEEKEHSDLDDLFLDDSGEQPDSAEKPGLQSDPSDLTDSASAPAPATNKRKSKPANLKKNPPSKKKAKSSGDDEDNTDLFNLMMTQQDEARKQRRADNKMFINALATMTQCVVAAITQNPTVISQTPAINNDSDEKSLSSYSTNDTPPTKRLKAREGKTKSAKKKKSKKTVETGEI